MTGWINRIRRAWTYRHTWRTPLGQDCISLDTALARWLGPRLVFLSENTHGFPSEGDPLEWELSLRVNGEALIAYADPEAFDDEEKREAGERAMKWVAENFRDLWD